MRAYEQCRAAEQAHVTGLTQLGIRNVSSTARDGDEGARRRGAAIRSVRQFRQPGTAGVLALIPARVRYYVTIDIDSFAPSIAPGTGMPSHGGFLCWRWSSFCKGRPGGGMVGIAPVVVAPAYAFAGINAILAAWILLNFLGSIFHERSRKAGADLDRRGAL